MTAAALERFAAEALAALAAGEWEEADAGESADGAIARRSQINTRAVSGYHITTGDWFDGV